MFPKHFAAFVCTASIHFIEVINLLKFSENPEQTSALIDFAFFTSFHPYYKHTKSRTQSEIMRVGYTLDIMRQTACLVFNPIMVEGYAALFSCTAVVQASDSMTASM